MNAPAVLRIDTKACKGPCKRELPMAAYYRDRSTADGHTVYCKACTLAYQKARNARLRPHRAATREQRKAERITRRTAEQMRRKAEREQQRKERDRDRFEARAARARARADRRADKLRAMLEPQLVTLRKRAEAAGVPLCDCASRKPTALALRSSAEGKPIEYLRKLYRQTRDQLRKHEIDDAAAVVVVQLVARGKIKGLVFDYDTEVT